MLYLFIVQGEGRGHLMQALAMMKLLEKHGHRVVEVLVGKSPFRNIPDFFIHQSSAPVLAFESPNFLPAQNKKVQIYKSLVYNLRNTHQFVGSMNFIKNRIKHHQPDVVVNFYDLIAGLTFGTYKLLLDCKFICIAHQYLILHPDFKLPNRFNPETSSLSTFTMMTSLNADKRLALSFEKYKKFKPFKLTSVPPILRQEILESQAEKEDFLLGYILNPVYEEEIRAWHQENPEQELHFFWDKSNAAEEVKMDSTLTMHRINDKKFIEKMRTCKGYASTGGFESICEALYLEKPVLMIPAHVEQQVNVSDAESVGAGIGAESFDLGKLLDFIPKYKPNKEFKNWVRMSEEIFIRELTEF